MGIWGALAGKYGVLRKSLATGRKYGVDFMKMYKNFEKLVFLLRKLTFSSPGF